MLLQSSGGIDANLHKWGLASSDKCECGTVQTMSHIVNECPVSKLHDAACKDSADDVAVNWLEGTAMKALVRYRVAQNKPDYFLYLSKFCISTTKHVNMIMYV